MKSEGNQKHTLFSEGERALRQIEFAVAWWPRLPEVNRVRGRLVAAPFRFSFTSLPKLASLSLQLGFPNMMCVVFGGFGTRLALGKVEMTLTKPMRESVSA